MVYLAQLRTFQKVIRQTGDHYVFMLLANLRVFFFFLPPNIVAPRYIPEGALSRIIEDTRLMCNPGLDSEAWRFIISF